MSTLTTMAFKVCFKCQREKPLSQFYAHPRMADGHVNKCKECAINDQKAARLARYGYYREQGRKYDAGRDNNQAVSEYRAMYPKVIKAQSRVRNAVRCGHLIRPATCELCPSTTAIEAHHADYDKPLSVQWLCSSCHKNWHTVNGPGANMS